MPVATGGGGEATHAGVGFQDDVAVLRIADMLAGKELKDPDLGRVTFVRVEAPAEVDDVVVGYSSGRTEYIQAKVNISPGDAAWPKMWKHFYDQFRQPGFRRGLNGDIITLVIGHSKMSVALQSLLAYAGTADSIGELYGRTLNQYQRELFDKLLGTLRPLTPPPDEEAVLSLCRQVRVKIEDGAAGLLDSMSFPNRVYDILKDRFTRGEGIYRVLVAIVLAGAPFNVKHTYESLISRLNESGIRPLPKFAERRDTYYGEYVHLMCDRVRQETQFTGSFHRHLTGALECGPQLFLIPGLVGEGHNNLAARFRYTVIEEYAKKRSAMLGPVAFKEIEEDWPTGGDLEENKDLLRMHVFKHFDKEYDTKSFDKLTADALRTLLQASRHSFVVIRHQIRDWDEGTIALINWYKHFWHSVRGDSVIPQCLIFINVMYSSNLLKRVRKLKGSDSNDPNPILTALQGASHQPRATSDEGGPSLNCFCVTLSELACVEPEHVRHWFDRFNVRGPGIDPEETEASIFRGRAGRALKCRPMSDVEPHLERAYETYLRGGAHV